MLKRKQILSLFLSTVLFLSIGTNSLYAEIIPEDAVISIISSSGYEEGAYATFDKLSDADGYEAYISKDSSDWIKLDNQLIREYPDFYRVDALGLTEGTWYIKITAFKSDNILTETISPALSVTNYDRSGFCFSGSSTPGAYNADGSLKSGAKIFYVSNNNISNLNKLITSNSKSICVYRFLGHIKYNSAAIKVPTLNNAITLEGVGEDATINGSEIDIKSGKNVEVRNLGFMNSNVGDHDCVFVDSSTYVWVHHNDMFYGMPGRDSDQKKGDGSIDCVKSDMITFSYNHMWDTGKVSLLGSSNSETTSLGKKITYHHNWFDHTEERHPRIRFFTAHVYNNYYDGISKYGIGATNNSSAFVENNYFRNTAYPMMISSQGSDVYRGTNIYNSENGTFSSNTGGIIKSCGNIFSGNCTFIPYGYEDRLNKGKLTANGALDSKTNFDAYVCKKTDTVPSDVKTTNGNYVYNNFDTASGMYKYTVDDTLSVPSIVMGKSGRLNGGDFWWNFDDINDDHDCGVNPDLKAALLAYKGKMISMGGVNKITVNTSLVDTSDSQPLRKKRSMTGNTDGNIFTDSLEMTEFGNNSVTVTGNIEHQSFDATDFITNTLNYPDSITRTFTDSIKYNETFSLSQFSLAKDETNFVTLLNKKGAVKINAPDKCTLTIHAGSVKNKDTYTSDIALYDSNNKLIKESTGDTSVAQRQGTTVHYQLPAAGEYTFRSPENAASGYDMTLYSIVLTTGEGDYTYDNPTNPVSRYNDESSAPLVPSPSPTDTITEVPSPSPSPTDTITEVPSPSPSPTDIVTEEPSPSPTATASVNRAPVASDNAYAAPGDTSSLGGQDSGNIKKLTITENDGIITVLKGTKAALTDVSDAASSAPAVLNATVKTKNGSKTLFIQALKEGQATLTFTTENGKTVKQDYIIEVPKKKKPALSVSQTPIIYNISDLFNISITAGKLTVKKQKGALAEINPDNQTVSITPSAKGSVKIEYRYLNKTFKTVIKIK